MSDTDPIIKLTYHADFMIFYASKCLLESSKYNHGMHGIYGVSAYAPPRCFRFKDY